MNLEKYNIRSASLFGLKATCFDPQNLKRCLRDAIQNDDQLVCYGYSLTLLPKFRQVPQICRISETFEIMVADGKGFYHLCRLFGVPLECDWALYELTDALLEQAGRDGFSVMLLGSDVENNQRATENLRKAWPDAKILNGHHGYFEKKEEPSVVSWINEQNPDILMLGMSSPKKEEFVLHHRHELKAKIIVPMGGVIDIYAGKTAPIPRIVKKLCLTWLYRFVQEPRRTRHIISGAMDVLFRLIPAMVLAKWVKKDANFSIPAFYGVPAGK